MSWRQTLEAVNMKRTVMLAVMALEMEAAAVCAAGQIYQVHARVQG